MTEKRAAFDIRQSANKIAAGIVVLLMLNLAAWFLVVRPRISELNTLRKESSPQLEKLRERNTEVEAGEQHLAALNKATEDLDFIRNEVLATAQERLVKVQLELSDLTGQFNIDLESVATNTDYLAEEGLERFTMVVPLQGGYTNLRHFMQAVESSDKFFVIERVAMDRAKDGGVLLQMTITLATYFDAPWLLGEGDS